MPLRLESAGGRLTLALAALLAGTARGAAQEHASIAAALKLEVQAAQRLEAEGNPEEARARAESLIERLIRADLAADERAALLRDAGALAYKLRALPRAWQAWEAVREHRQATLAPDDLELQNARGNVAWIGEQMGLVHDARALEELILASVLRTFGSEHDAVQIARANLGDTLLQVGEPEGALELFLAVAQARDAALPEGHPKRLRAAADLAAGLAGTGDLEGARAALESVLAAARDLDPFDGIVLRARAGLVLVHAARHARGPFAAEAARLADAVDAGFAAARALPGREAEARRAELAPLVDLILSCAVGLGQFRHDPELEARAAEWIAPVRRPRLATFHRWERSMLTGEARDARVLAVERLGAFVQADEGPRRWLDLGPMNAVRSAVGRWRGHVPAEAAHSPERAAGEDLRTLVLDPVVAALGSPPAIAVIPDDVLWSLPLEALPQGEGRVADERRIEVLDPTPTRVAPRAASARRLALRDPSADAEVDAGAGGAAASLAANRVRAARGAGRTWDLEGFEVLDGAQASRAALASAAPEVAVLVLDLPVWSAPAGTPRLSTPRVLRPEASLGTALVREDVVGGSPEEALAGLAFAGYGRAAGADGRVRGLATLGDLAALDLGGTRLVLVTSAPSPEPADAAAADLEALSAALHAAGAREAWLAAWPAEPAAVAALATALSKSLRGADLDGAPDLRTILAEQRAAGRPLREFGGWIAIRAAR